MSGTQSYSEAEHHAALELAATVGVSAAARQLGLQRKQLYRWREKYPQLWSDLSAGDPTVGRRRIAQSLETLADRYASAEHDLLDSIEDGVIKAKDAKDAAALLKGMSSGRAAAIAGARTISGDPEVHEHNINFPQIEAAMERLLEIGGTRAQPALVPTAVEGTAEAWTPVSSD